MKRSLKGNDYVLFRKLNHLEQKGAIYHQKLIELAEEFSEKIYKKVENKEIIPILFREYKSHNDHGDGIMVLIAPAIDLSSKTISEIERYYNKRAKEIINSNNFDIDEESESFFDKVDTIVYEISKRSLWGVEWGLISYMRILYSSSWNPYFDNIVDYAIDVIIPNT